MRRRREKAHCVCCGLWRIVAARDQDGEPVCAGCYHNITVKDPRQVRV